MTLNTVKEKLKKLYEVYIILLKPFNQYFTNKQDLNTTLHSVSKNVAMLKTLGEAIILTFIFCLYRCNRCNSFPIFRYLQFILPRFRYLSFFIPIIRYLPYHFICLIFRYSTALMYPHPHPRTYSI